ncbi:hypothetical protein EQ826_20745 [Ectopseudomonas mendocina]|nr:hypothetical protein [Pseudomonas mendocina]TRO22596.1 hypothetical protein EQ826_20745 [Pseudomonas mendocina]
MNKTIITALIAASAIISTSSIAAPKIEHLPQVAAGKGIPKSIRIASNGAWDSYSFSFETSDSHMGIFSTVRANGGSANRYLVISESPGDFANPVNGAMSCTSGRSLRDATVRWTSDASQYGCNLKPNQVYYLNVKPLIKCDNRTQESCSFTLHGSAQKKK